MTKTSLIPPCLKACGDLYRHLKAVSLSQGMCWPVAGLNCKQMSVRDCAHVCVSARQVTVCEQEPRRAKRWLLPAASLMPNPLDTVPPSNVPPVCVRVFIHLRESAHSGLLTWDMTSDLVSEYVCVCVCVRGWLSCQKPVCPRSPGTAPSTRCDAGRISWHGRRRPLYGQKILPRVNTNNNLHWNQAKTFHINSSFLKKIWV